MTYRLVFETTADKRRFVDLAGEEYPSKILDELESAATSGGVVSVRGRALGVPEGSLIYLNPRAALFKAACQIADRQYGCGFIHNAAPAQDRYWPP